MRKLFFLSGMLLVFNVFNVWNVWAEMKTPRIFSDNMVLQRDIPAPVWGWADPGEKVTVKFKEQEKSAIADADGKWIVRLKPLSASAQPEKLTITGKTDRKEFGNVVVGDVWLCSGQSNMEAGFGDFNELGAEAVDYPQIRLLGGLSFPVPVPQGPPLGIPYNGWAGWEPCKSAEYQTVLFFFSRVGYYFGLKLWQELNIPIGLVNVSRGCSSIEAWMPPESFSANDDWKENLAETEKTQQFYLKYNQYSVEEKERIFLEHCNSKYGGYAKNYLKDGKPIPEHYKDILDHMLAVKSSMLYIYAIRPIIPFGIKGVIWYQGETNLSDDQYAQKQQSLIENWRKLWGEGDFPFYIVQIAPGKGSGGFMPGFWLEQYKAVSKTKNTGIAATVDISDINTSHPKNKHDVGLRLALLALRDTYGRKDIVASGPVYKSMKIMDGKIMVSFNSTGSGLTTRDGKAPDWFEIAGADRNFLPAQAAINGDMVEVSSPKVAKPKHVRYGWNDIAEPNLRNKEGLPAWPFNTSGGTRSTP